jgi:tetratricopeptide (TPR) repeat protein
VDAQQVHEALRDNATRPYGPARSARAEQLVELAAQTGDRPMLVHALQALITAYEYDGTSDRMLVPFARVLKMWDERPEDFDEEAAHGLHWHFKWVSAGLIWQPNVPLATIERWLDEMERRYRLAGYGTQAVHACRHYVAAHLGDTEAAATHFDRWVTAERDDMADCEACERHNRGDWLTMREQDAEAVRTWQAVTDGHLVCAEEPHRVLAKTLLPLLRLDRADEARANHLRGYRMVRGNPNLRSSVGEHLEFAALTGNEGRALEILADHATWLTLGGDEPVRYRLFYLEAVVVLLRRLVALGQGDLELPTPRGETPTTTVVALLPAVDAEVDSIVATFDKRNGTTSVSERSRERRTQEPLLASLPLGLRAGTVVPRTPVHREEQAADGPAPDDAEALIAEATRLSEAHDPRAHAAWERVAATGADLPPLVRARIAESRVLERADEDPVGVGADFLAVAREFGVAGEAGREAVNRARAGLGALIGGAEPPPGTDPAEVLAEVTALHEAGEATRNTLWVARFCHVQSLFLGWARAPEGRDPDDPARAELDRVLTDLLAEASELPFEQGSLLHIRAQVALSEGDPRQALDVLPRAADKFLAAGAVNRAADSLQLLAEVTMRGGDPRAAEAHLERARAVGGDRLDADTRGRIAALLAEIYVMLGGRDGDAVGSALTAAHLLDDSDPVVAARARMVAVFAFRRGGRPAEAAALLESMLPDVDRRGDENEIAHVRHMYGECLTDLGEYRAAAEELIAAARIVADRPDQREHAALVHAAANALDGAGMSDEAGRTFDRAAALWRTVGDRDAEIRAVRGHAWTLVQGEKPDWPGALEMLDSVAAESAEPGYEYYETLRQTTHLVLNWPSEDRSEKLAARALDLADTAADGFFRLDEPGVATQTQFTAANLEAWGLGRVDEARARLTALRDRHRAAGRDDLVAKCDDFLEHLEP